MGAQLSTGFQAQMLKPTEVASMLRVSLTTIHTWIKEDRIPYIKLPGGEERARYLIPLRGLVGSLSSNYDLAGNLDELAAAAKASGFSEAEAIAASGGDPEDND
jgi:excisionase family DNA binding protein